ncbi:MAG TPA: NUDIX hydrolase [Candidatus Nitrosotalea sp.]|nr:NUDIX hydrolase [Candidatus Nitrosotalea sp.]
MSRTAAEPAPTPRPAATVVLVDGRAPWRVLLVRRPATASFGPGRLVFPGGAVDAGDELLGEPERVAAVRELFEEAGMLLARTENGQRARAREQQALRSAVDSGLTFQQGLLRLGLRPDLARLAPLARIVTPPWRPRRFDTHFYIAQRPSGQSVIPQIGEVTDWTWASAAQLGADLDAPLMVPTRAVLAWVGEQEDIVAFIARRRRRRRPPLAVSPAPHADDDPWPGWLGPWPPP